MPPSMSRDETASQMGNYLVQGWTMLSQACPTADCNVPLLRSRDRSVEFCVRCQRGPLQSNGHRPPPALDSTPAPAVASVAGETVQVPTTTSTEPSKAIGELLLLGWTMLAETCTERDCRDRGIPLMRKKRGETDALTYCVNCKSTASAFRPSRRHGLSASQSSAPPPPPTEVENEPGVETSASTTSGTRIAPPIDVATSIDLKLAQLAASLSECDPSKPQVIRELAEALTALYQLRKVATG